MSIPKTYHGSTYNIPENKDLNWGSTMTSVTLAVLTDLDSLVTLVGGVPQFVFKSTTQSLAAGATITPATPWHRVAGSGGAVTLSAGTSIADGTTDGQLLIVTGWDSTNTVTILDGSNVTLNGDATLGLGETVALIWDDTAGYWQEIWRSF